MKKIILFAALALFVSAPAMAAVNTSEALVKVYKAWISTDPTCAPGNLTLIYNAETDTSNLTRAENALGWYTVQDMVQNPTIGTASVAAGTYHCIVFEMSDNLTFTPSESEGLCVEGTEYTIDVCNDWGGDYSPTIVDAETGLSTGTCAQSSTNETLVWTYVSTYSTTETGDMNTECFMPPTAANDDVHGFKMASGAFTVSANFTGTFIFGTDGKINDTGGGSCNMDPPDFGFRVD